VVFQGPSGIEVKGTLEVKSSAANPAVFDMTQGGLQNYVILNAATGRIKNAKFFGGIFLARNSSLSLSTTDFTKGSGLCLQGATQAKVKASRFYGNAVGMMLDGKGLRADFEFNVFSDNTIGLDLRNYASLRFHNNITRDNLKADIAVARGKRAFLGGNCWAPPAPDGKKRVLKLRGKAILEPMKSLLSVARAYVEAMIPVITDKDSLALRLKRGELNTPVVPSAKTPGPKKQPEGPGIEAPPLPGVENEMPGRQEGPAPAALPTATPTPPPPPTIEEEEENAPSAGVTVPLPFIAPSVPEAGNEEIPSSGIQLPSPPANEEAPPPAMEPPVPEFGNPPAPPRAMDTPTPAPVVVEPVPTSAVENLELPPGLAPSNAPSRQVPSGPQVPAGPVPEVPVPGPMEEPKTEPAAAPTEAPGPSIQVPPPPHVEGLEAAPTAAPPAVPSPTETPAPPQVPAGPAPEVPVPTEAETAVSTPAASVETPSPSPVEAGPSLEMNAAPQPQNPAPVPTAAENTPTPTPVVLENPTPTQKQKEALESMQGIEGEVGAVKPPPDLGVGLGLQDIPEEKNPANPVTVVKPTPTPDANVLILPPIKDTEVAPPKDLDLPPTDDLGNLNPNSK
jgi:hypothetical protein